MLTTWRFKGTRCTAKNTDTVIISLHVVEEHFDQVKLLSIFIFATQAHTNTHEHVYVRKYAAHTQERRNQRSSETLGESEPRQQI